MGSVEINKLGYRQSWAFIGILGYKDQMVEKRDGNTRNKVTLEKGFRTAFLSTLSMEIKVMSAGFRIGNYAKIF